MKHTGVFSESIGGFEVDPELSPSIISTTEFYSQANLKDLDDPPRDLNEDMVSLLG